MLQHIVTADIGILYWIQENLRVSFLDMPMAFLSRLGDAGLIWLIIIAVLLITPKYRRAGLTALLAIVFSLIICNLILKPLIHRARPYELYDYITVLIKYPTDFSFPSGHVSSSFAVSVALTCSFKKKGVWFIILAALISFSRLYVGVHFPTDILAGIVTGIVSGLLAVFIVNKLNERQLLG